MNTDFRYLARTSLQRAKSELAAGQDDRLVYVALELRNAIEAITYDRAYALKDEIPPETYKTWQPRKLIAAIVEIDPKLDMNSTLSFGVEKEYGVAAVPEDMQTIGTEVVLTFADIKAHYDALGSYLHMPTLGQLETGKVPSQAKLRDRCQTLVNILDSVLSSSVWNITLGTFSTLAMCVNDECKMPVRRRIPAGQEQTEARCFNCDAEYVITRQSDGKAFWDPKYVLIPCPTINCPASVALWPNEIQPETNWRCRECGSHNKLSLIVAQIKKSPPEKG